MTVVVIVEYTIAVTSTVDIEVTVVKGVGRSRQEQASEIAEVA